MTTTAGTATIRLIPSTTPTGPLHGRSLLFIRVVWVLTLLLLSGLFMVGLDTEQTRVNMPLCRAYTQGLQELGQSQETCQVLESSYDIVYLIVYMIVAALLFWGKSGDRMATYASFMLLFFGFATPSPIIELFALRTAWYIPAMLTFSLSIGLFLIFFYRFPDGHFVPRWTRPLSVVWVLWVLSWAFVPALNPVYGHLSSGFLVITACFLTAIFAQIYRYRTVSTPIQRQQTKGIVFGIAVLAIFYAISVILDALPLASRVDAVGVLIHHGLNLFHYSTLGVFPVIIAFSVLRFRLWELDIVINRTLVYGTLTALLALVFIVGVIGVQQIAVALTGGQQSSLAVAISALAIAALFQPVRKRLQTLIDLRFYPQYLKKLVAPSIDTHEPAGVGLLTGKKFGHYEVLEPIGRGGMAEVYRGRHTSLDRIVAIKVLLAQLSVDDAFRKRFEREARAVSALHHPNIIQVFDFGELDGAYYMIMEYIVGQDLSHFLAQSGPLRLAQIQTWIVDLADALDYAHTQGVVHRDIKPSNVMLQKITSSSSADNAVQYRPILMDFGIAKLQDGGPRLTNTGTVGTLDYIAPEQIISAADVDGRADLYALGIMVYQMLTGQLPFAGSNPGALILAHLQRPAPDPRKLVQTLPSHAAKAILRVLAKEPRDRFRTAREFTAALLNQGTQV